jgi:ribosomal protein S4E
VIAGTGLSGGGALTGNVTLNVTANSTNQKVTVQNNGVAVGSEPAINFIPGANITITTADDVAGTRANVTIALTSGTLGTIASQNANSVTITGGTISNVTFSNVSINTAIVTKSANYTAVAADETILGNASAGAITITLPTSVGASGKVYTIKKVDSSANAVTVGTTTSQTIDGVTTYSLANQYGGVTVQSDGANWLIIGNIWGRNGTTGTF